MTPPTLTQRVAALEQKLVALEAGLKANEVVRDWRRSVGMFTGDAVMKEICEVALEYREADRHRARRRNTPKR